MKKLISILIAVCMIIMLAACTEDIATREHIVSMFAEKKSLFLEAVNSGDYTEIEKMEAVESIHVSDSCVEFSFGGAGFGSETMYRGIFYSAEDNLFAPYGTGPTDKLVPHEAGYLYQEDQGDNRYYVEPLGDHFYYYESQY